MFDLKADSKDDAFNKLANELWNKCSIPDLKY
jgi:hypothetical protein